MTVVGDLSTLGFDPTPGDPELLWATLATLRGAAQALDEIARVLHGTGSEETAWRGQAAQAFREVMDSELRPRVDVAAEAFGGAVRALDGWHGYLQVAQTTTRRLAADADAALADLTRAQLALGAAPPPSTGLAGSPADVRRADAVTLDHATLTRAVGTAQETLDAIRQAARRHGEEYQTEGARVAGILAHSIDAAPNEPGLFDRLGDAVGGWASSTGSFAAKINDAITAELARFAPALQLIGDISGALAAVTGLLAFVPGFQFLGPVALGLGLVALATHYLAAAGREGNLLQALATRDVVLDTVGVVAGIGAARYGAKVLTAANAAGNPTKMVPQLIGRAQEVPLGYFALARSTSYATGPAEFSARVVQYRLTAVGNAAQVIGTPDLSNNLRDWSRHLNPRAR